MSIHMNIFTYDLVIGQRYTMLSTPQINPKISLQKHPFQKLPVIIDHNHSYIGQHRKSQDENINHKSPLVLYVNSSTTSLVPGTIYLFVKLVEYQNL